MDIRKVTSKCRVTIPVGAVVELEVCEEFGFTGAVYGKFYLRKKHVVSGLLQMIHTPFKSGWYGTPRIVVKNESLIPFELMVGEEIGEMWTFKEVL